jgi:hypothetical protein
MSKPVPKQITVHMLHFGTAVCRFSHQTPDKWPDNHAWISSNDHEILHEINCQQCLSVAQAMTDLVEFIDPRTERRPS